MVQTKSPDTPLNPAAPIENNPAASSQKSAAPRRFGTSRSAFLVAAGIFLSRISGLIRDRFFAHYFGNSDAADAFKAAIRIPNFLQNLFGEGVLSASFIPVYAALLARDDREEADRVAGGIFALLALTASLLVLLGVLTTPWLIEIIAPGFGGEKRQLTIHLVRILFPGAGLLVLSAWCLGILNSHRKFFLSYTAPVIWNAAMIATLIFFGARMTQFPLAAALSWGAVIGSALQVGVQWPVVMHLLGRFRLTLHARADNIRTVVRNFIPVFISRGVVQISAYVDSVLASLVGTGAVAALSYAQTLYTLPVSLFGMAVSAAELPVMSGQLGSEDEVARALRTRLDAGLRQIAYFVVPSVVAFLALGDIIVSAIYQSGKFTHADALYVWGILAGSTVGLLASTLGRLYSSTYYALRDTRTPLRFAVIRVALTTILGYLSAVPLPHLLGIDQRWGVAGLTISAGISGWVEFLLLRHYLNRRIGKTGLPLSFSSTIWGIATAAAGVAWAVRWVAGAHRPILMALVVLIPYGLVYLGVTFAVKLPEAKSLGAMFSRFTTR